MAAPRSDVAIYSPFAAVVYERWGAPEAPVDESRSVPGGAAVQTSLLATALAKLGWRVAHIVFPLHRHPGFHLDLPVELIERRRYSAAGGIAAGVLELYAVVESLRRADARIYVFRGSSGKVIVGAIYAIVRRRRLVFSAANDLDFNFERPDRSRIQLRLFRWALGRAHGAVFQTDRQARIAAEAGCRFPISATVPSLAEVSDAPDRKRTGFLWIGRIVDYKRPLHYIRLAERLPDLTFKMIALEVVESSAALREEIESASRELPNLEIVAPRPRVEVLEMMSEAYAIVSTSEYEGMPNVFLEAWARGIPALSFDFDPDGRIAAAGLGIVADGSMEAFVEGALALSAADSEARGAYAERTRRFIADRHSPRAVASAWQEVLEEVSDRGPGWQRDQR